MDINYDLIEAEKRLCIINKEEEEKTMKKMCSLSKI